MPTEPRGLPLPPDVPAGKRSSPALNTLPKSPQRHEFKLSGPTRQTPTDDRSRNGRRVADIIADSERLRSLAHDAGCDMLAFQLELVLHEARAILMADGHESKATEPSDGGSSGSSVVTLPWPPRS